LRQFLIGVLEAILNQPLENHDNGDEAALIVFTSGTSLEPKGCIHTGKTLYSQTQRWNEDSNTRALCCMSICHIAGINPVLRAWRFGGCVYFPAEHPDPEATLQVIEQETFTHMSAVPLFIKMLTSSSSFKIYPGRIQTILLGGSTVTKDDIDLCQNTLGADRAFELYAMTECGPAANWPFWDAKTDYVPGAGKASYCIKLRICARGSQEVLKYGEVGELHISGTSVIHTYLNGVSDDSFYYVQGEKWLISGDEAKIDNEGTLHILGRYKDIIVRGGMNISAAKIEKNLNSTLVGLQVRIYILYLFRRH
jgi:acyl-CoA synthetase (AMP-forming)/AMP-acid ligase II